MDGRVFEFCSGTHVGVEAEALKAIGLSAKRRPPEAAWSRALAAFRAFFDGEANPVCENRASLALCAALSSAAAGVGGTGPTERRAGEGEGTERPPNRPLLRPLRTASARLAACVEETR